MSYDTYAHLLGLPYQSGNQDCYGLARRYYKERYDLTLLNFARPEQWWSEPNMDILTQFLDTDGWTQVGCNSRLLRPGDGLIFSLVHDKANHVGVYVGNGMFIHHLWNNFSREEAVTPKWTNRLLHVVRHKEVTAFLDKNQTKLDYSTIMPEYAKRKISVPT